jgi:hypothetical protein
MSVVTWSITDGPTKKPVPHSGCSRAVEVGDHLVAMLARDERSHLGLRVHAVAHPELRGALEDRLHERLRDVPDRHDRRDGHAALARRSKHGRHGGVGGHVDVGVREHDHVVLRAGEGLHALAVRGTGRVDVLRDGGRADEAHSLDVRMLEDPVDDHLVALHDLEHTVWKARLLEDLREEQRSP